MILQLAFVLTAIIIGARLGGIGLGVMGGVGLGILTFAIGFLNIACITTPESASPIPAAAERMIRGTRRSRTISAAAPSHPASAPSTSGKDNGIYPSINPARHEKSSTETAITASPLTDRYFLYCIRFSLFPKQLTPKY